MRNGDTGYLNFRKIQISKLIHNFSENFIHLLKPNVVNSKTMRRRNVVLSPPSLPIHNLLAISPRTNAIPSKIGNKSKTNKLDQQV
jgi:hypothetical protein